MTSRSFSIFNRWFKASINLGFPCPVAINSLRISSWEYSRRCLNSKILFRSSTPPKLINSIKKEKRKILVCDIRFSVIPSWVFWSGLVSLQWSLENLCTLWWCQWSAPFYPGNTYLEDLRTQEDRRQRSQQYSTGSLDENWGNTLYRNWRCWWLFPQ